MPGDVTNVVSIPMGADGKVYLGEQEVSTVQNVTVNLEMGEADVTSRGSGGVKEILPTLMDANVEFTMLWDKSDPSFQLLSRSFFRRKPIECKFLDGEYVASSAGTGLHAWCGVFSFSREEQLDGAMVANVKMRPTYVGSDAALKPKWLENGVPLTDDDTPSGG